MLYLAFLVARRARCGLLCCGRLGAAAGMHVLGVTGPEAVRECKRRSMWQRQATGFRGRPALPMRAMDAGEVQGGLWKYSRDDVGCLCLRLCTFLHALNCRHTSCIVASACALLAPWSRETSADVVFGIEAWTVFSASTTARRRCAVGRVEGDEVQTARVCARRRFPDGAMRLAGA